MSDSPAELPFRATVVPVESNEPMSDSLAHPDVDEDWSEQDLEALYQQTLEAVDAATEDVSRIIGESEDEECHELPALDALDPITDAPADQERDSEDQPEKQIRISARQVVEAVMFVGGGPVTGKQLAELLGGESTHELVDEVIESLNTLYVNQSRPYEIRLFEGGYQLTLRREYDRVRHRVYGLGPKEVKLSQDALELMALVAYQQPISKAAIDEVGKANASTVLRQLLRRELIALERDDEDNKTVVYRTTSRFLEVFGLNTLDDLPQMDDLMIR